MLNVYSFDEDIKHNFIHTARVFINVGGLRDRLVTFIE